MTWWDFTSSRQSTTHVPRRVSSPTWPENACLGFPRWVGSGVEPCCSLTHPRLVMGTAELRGLRLGRNGLKPETPSRFPPLTSALIWNREAFAIGSCLPIMDQNPDKRYLADLALGNTHNAFLKLLWTHSLIVSSCEQHSEDLMKWISLLFSLFLYWALSPIVARSEILLKNVHWCKNIGNPFSLQDILGTPFRDRFYKSLCSFYLNIGPRKANKISLIPAERWLDTRQKGKKKGTTKPIVVL